MTLIVVPWRDPGDDDGLRSRACRCTCTVLRHLLPGVLTILVDSGHEPFSRAASRNLGVSRANPDEVVVVSDADIVLDCHWNQSAQPLKVIVDLAAHDGQLHYPFNTCHYLGPKASWEVINGDPPNPDRLEFSISGAQGGLMVMRADAWQAAGGMDERFIGWGYEDNAWHARVSRAIGPPAHHSGILWHLHHQSERYRGTADELHNLALARDPDAES